MIDKPTAKALATRFSGLKWYPREAPEALAEICRILQTAESEIVATYVVNGWIDDHDECPTPAQLRKMIVAANNKRQKEVSHCSICDGTGQQVVWILVTYNGRSLTVKKQEILKDFNDEKAKEFGKSLRWEDGTDGPFMGDNQQIVTGARLCACKKGLVQQYDED
ncbi:MAG TPA: hypothetical protein VNH19_20800 [Candidatus Limnocylindrales bacterium]|nr:hypothetical protein [Candidatus Limnocylindrales bacterium]